MNRKKPGEGVLTYNTLSTRKEGIVGRGWVAKVVGQLSCVTCLPNAPREFIQQWPPEDSDYPRRLTAPDAVQLAQINIHSRAVAACVHLKS